jgi:hypothetical protein
VNYRISDAEERETRRKIALIRSMLERCARLQRDLAKFESVAGENWSETLARYRKLVTASKRGDFVDDYNRLYDELPRVERQLEKRLTEAKAKRLRLKLTAATLVASAKTPAERQELEAISKGGGGISADNFGEAQSKIELLVRQRLETPLEVAEPEITADQVALARDLLASSPVNPRGPVRVLQSPVIPSWNVPSRHLHNPPIA